MTMKRGRPGSPEVRKGGSVGPDYPESNFVNPVNMGIDREYTEGDGKKTLVSPSANTITGCGQPMRDRYNELWEGK